MEYGTTFFRKGKQFFCRHITFPLRQGSTIGSKYRHHHSIQKHFYTCTIILASSGEIVCKSNIIDLMFNRIVVKIWTNSAALKMNAMLVLKSGFSHSREVFWHKKPSGDSKKHKANVIHLTPVSTTLDIHKWLCILFFPFFVTFTSHWYCECTWDPPPVVKDVHLYLLQSSDIISYSLRIKHVLRLHIQCMLRLKCSKCQHM